MRDEPPRDDSARLFARAGAMKKKTTKAWSRRAFLATRRRVYEYDCKTTMTNAHHILRLRVNNVIRFARRIPHLATGLGLRNVRARRRGGGKRYKLQELCVHSRCFQNRLEAVRGQNSRAQFLYMMNKAGLGMHLK